MGELNMDDMSPQALSEQARKVHLAATESGDGVDQEELKRGCRALEKCDEMISKLGLFSTNETKEGI